MNFDKRLLRLLQSVRLWLGLTVTLGVIGGVLVVGQAYLLASTISRVFLGGETLQTVTPALFGLLIVAGVRFVVTWASHSTGHETASRIIHDLRERFFAHLLALGPSYTQGERSGELVNTALHGIGSLDAYFSQYLPQVALSALIPISYLLVVFPTDALSGVVLLLTAPLIPIFMVLIGSAAQRLTQQQWQTLSRMSAHFLDVLQGITTLKIFGRSRRQIDVIQRISDQWRFTTLGVLRVAFLSALALELIATISTAIVAVEIGLRLLYGGIDFTAALFVLILAPEFYIPLRTLGVRFHAGMTGVAAAERIFAVLETQPQIDAVQAVPSVQRLDAFLESRETNTGRIVNFIQTMSHKTALGDITFDDVHFAYDDDRAALNGVSLRIAPGQTVALVGPSGSGKSTIASLLLRFVASTGGSITVGDVPLAQIDAAAWRRSIAWVPQRPYLFNSSVLDNIRLGSPHATPDEVRFAARQAFAEDFIMALPDGFNTIIGERGARLSGGQAQRIALARAFLRDAPFLILDEATANLDADSESQVQAAMQALMARRTVLVIAHRLRTVTSADQIIVLADGQIAETGDHAALLAAGGLYARLVTAYHAG